MSGDRLGGDVHQVQALRLSGTTVPGTGLRHKLGLVAGLVLYGWILGHSAVVHPAPAERAWAREELGWWVPRVRTALERYW